MTRVRPNDSKSDSILHSNISNIYLYVKKMKIDKFCIHHCC